MLEQRTVPPALANQALDALVRTLFETSWGKARSWIESGKIFVGERVALDARAPVAAGAVLTLKMNAPRPRGGVLRPGQAVVEVPKFDRGCLVHVDPQLVVVDKPPGINSVPFEEGEKGALVDVVQALLGGRGRLEVVQRLDRETSGLIVFARNREAARELGNQFRFHRVHRRYQALAHGVVGSKTIRSTLILDRGDGLRGSAPAGWKVAPGQGKEATTHVVPLERLEGATRVECRLETGRTHQIRIHLSEAGHPLLGERLYVRDYEGEVLPAPRVMLHAAELGFRHPVNGEQLIWRSSLPADFEAAAERLR